MAINSPVVNGLRRPEKFMGAAEQVAPPALPNGAPGAAPVAPAAAAAAPTAPIAGSANLMGSGSAPIGGTGGAAADAAPVAGRLSGLASGARALVNGGVGKLVAGGAVAQAVGDQMAPDSTTRYAQRFGVSEPTGDGSLGDIAKFVGLRVGGFASDLGNHLTGGLAGNLYRDNPGAANAATPAVAAPQTPNAATTPQPTAEPALLAGSPLIGADGVRKVVAPGAAPLYTNAPSNAADQAFQKSNGSVNTIGGSSADNISSMNRVGDLQAQISTMQAGLRDRGDPYAYLRGASAQAGMQPGGMSDELQAQISRLTGKKNLTAAGVQALGTLVGLRNQVGQHASEIGERAREADIAAQTAARGQDVMMQGHVMTAKTAANAARIAQMNADREFGLKGAEFNAKREQENFTQREQATKDLNGEHEAMFTTTDKDGKTVVDKARAAKYTMGMQTFLGNRQNELQQLVDSGKATPEDVTSLNQIKAKGLGALDSEDRARLRSQLALGERAQQTSGLTGGWSVASSNPGDYAVVGRKQNLFGSDTLVTKNGSTVRENDVKYDEPGNTLLPNILKHKTSDFDLAKGLRQK